MMQVKQSEQNGTLRISRKGRCKFAFGDDPEFLIDVVAAFDEWCQIDSSFRDDKGELPKDQVCAYAGAKLSFVQQLTATAYAQQLQGTQPPNLSHAEAAEFVTLVQQKVQELRPFFAPKSADVPSSPESMELRFSQ